jgi:hypothetical protein
MDRISSHLNIPKPTKANGGVNSPFNDAVDRALDTIGEDRNNPKIFPYWCGRLRGIHPQFISHMAAKAKEGRNPIALFSWLIKEHRKQQKLAEQPPKL